MPIPTTALRLADTVAGAFGWLGRPFAADDLIRLARRRTGLEDFGDVDLGEPLRRFLDACAAQRPQNAHDQRHTSHYT